MLITRAGAPLVPESSRDIITLMQVINEGASPLFAANLGRRSLEQLGFANDEELDESLLKHAINGYLYCNTPNLTMRQGET